MRKFLRSLICSLSLSLSCAPVRADDSPQWLSYAGGDGPGKGKRIVLIAADQEYRSEQSMPMMAKILSKHHGFDCTVLFAVNGPSVGLAVTSFILAILPLIGAVVFAR